MRVLPLSLLLFPLSILAQQRVGINTTNPQHPFQVNVDSAFIVNVMDQSLSPMPGFTPGLALAVSQKGAQPLPVGHTGQLKQMVFYFALPTVADQVLIQVFTGSVPGSGTLLTSTTLTSVTVGVDTAFFPQPWPQVTDGDTIHVVMTHVAGTSLKWKQAAWDVNGYHFTAGTWNPVSLAMSVLSFITYPDTTVHDVLKVREDRRVMINDYALPRYDGEPGQILQTDGSGNVTWIPSSVFSQPTGLSDTDQDTRVEVEAAPDEDVIRMTTDGEERLTILQNGKIGINTTNPVSDLDIRGDDDVQDGGELQLATPGMTNFIRMFGGRTGDRNPFLAFHDLDTFRFVTTSTDWTTFTRRITLTPDGRLGLGTEKPTSSLHILSNSLTSFAQLRLTESSALDFARIKMENQNQPGVFWDVAGLADSSATTSKLNFYFGHPTVSGDRMTIRGDGNVGIGTTNPGNRLRVNGSTTSSQHVFSAGTNYSGNVHIRAVEGFSTPAEGYGIAGYFVGGYKAIDATANGGAATGTVTGVEATATGSAGTRIGLFGAATGGATNWAGYFGPGHVRVENNLFVDDFVGIGTMTPTEKLHVIGDMRVSGLAGSGDRNVIVDSNGKLKPSTLGAGGGGWIETPDYVYNNTHNIGIGTSTPSSRLHIIQGGSASAQSIVFPGTPPFNTDAKVMTLDAGNLNVTGTLNSTLALQGTSDGPVTLVQGGGNVGIGSTAATNKKLTIQGPSINPDLGFGTISIVSNIGGLSEMLLDGRSIETHDHDLRINYESPHDIILGSISEGTNRVGIGTNSPTSKLSVHGPEGSGTTGILKLQKTSSPFYMVLDNNELDVVGEPFFINANSGENVAIGTLDPAAGYKLSVGGKVIAEEVRVQLQTAWPDYVFQTGYALMPLQEVKAVIERQGHLPGIPSAAEVETQGILLGDMQRMMMEKIEELTLHLIDMDQRIKLLEAENKELRASIKNHP